MKPPFAARIRAYTVAAALVLLALAGLSAPASAQAADATFAITGGGWGHGIGLSQYGAKGFAQRGRDYSWILSHFYQGTRLETRTMPVVRVDLDDGKTPRSTWRVRSGSTTASLTISSVATASISCTMPPGQTAWITFQGGDLVVSADEWDPLERVHRRGTVLRRFSGNVLASTGSRASSLVQLVSPSGPFNETEIKWHGHIKFVVNSAGTAANAVNYVTMEKYLRGVVPRESPSGWPAEALKAQAVAARSYAYGPMDSRGVLKSILHCTTSSQVYNGAACDNPAHARHDTATTNAAISATTAQVVMSGSTVVTTYFSSSSGGHTASVQDVWVASTPRSYYRGVDDADDVASGNPHFKWSAGTFTGATIGARIREHFAGRYFSEPSPASVVGISVERAESGFVHHLTLRWSNGEAHRLTGDNLRHALGLKSSKFYVNKSGGSPPPTRYDEEDSRLAWSGEWRTATSTALSGGTLRRASAVGATCFVAFKGSAFAWIGNRGPSYGKAEVYIDDTYVSTVDLYAASTQFRQRLFSRSGLSTGTHVVRIRTLGLKAAASSGTTVSVDAFDISDGSLSQASVPPTRAEESDSRIALVGGWTSAAGAGLSGGRHAYTQKAGARACISFNGSGMSWTGRVGPGYGTATVRVDGGASATVSATATSTADKRVIWSVTGLDRARAHTVVITADGVAPGGSATAYISLDAVDISDGSLIRYTPPKIRIQDSSRSLAWTGTWKASRSTHLSGGSQRLSRTAGSSATIAFEGTSVTWIGNRAPSYGKAYVYVDGKRVGTLDLYARKVAYARPLFTRGGLRYGNHTMRVRVAGTRNRASRGYAVAIDAFDVCGILAAR